MKRKTALLLVAQAWCFPLAFGQIKYNAIECRIKNDNLGSLSEWLHTGDDLGETHASSLALHLLQISNTYNFHAKVESTEYAALYTQSSEPRDISFTELNNWQLSFDNQKFNPATFFFSAAVGMYQLQGNKITIGATGQKYYLHQWVLNKLYADRYWIYRATPGKPRYLPYTELKYGYNTRLFERRYTRLMTINSLESRIAGDVKYAGLGAKTGFNFSWHNDRYLLHTLNLELEGYYFSNFIQYQMIYAQVGASFHFNRVGLYTQLNKPLKKYLDNPLLVGDDLELQFIFGLLLGL